MPKKSPQLTFSFDNLPVQVVQEGEYFVFFSSALELSGYGTSFEEGQKNFIEQLNIFIEEGLKDKTLLEQLIKLGWVEKNSVVKPPKYIGTINISKPEAVYA
jgi:hypothetical protein